jgi:REP element-mobilizing transposase RayT
LGGGAESFGPLEVLCPALTLGVRWVWGRRGVGWGLAWAWGWRGVAGWHTAGIMAGMGTLADTHRVPGALSLGYFITVRTYGTWLHGDERGSVDRWHNVPGTPLAAADAARERWEAKQMKHGAMTFGARAAELVEGTVKELCEFRGWHLFAVKMRSNHLHVVVEAKVSAERVLADVKARTTRRLREERFVKQTEHPWAVHGSTPYLWTPEQLMGAIDYVENRQGGPLKGE